MANPEIAAIRGFLAQGPQLETTAELRQMYDGLGSQFPMAPDIEVVKVSAGGVPSEWSTSPSASEDRVLLYLHGGGYVIGSLNSHRHLASELARAAGAKSLAVDYRLAPEHPFPAAVDDALAAYRFLLKSGIKPGGIAIAGDSAGGGLTVALLLAIKEAGLEQPACGVCISPWVDLEGLGGSMESKSAEDPMVQKAALVAWAALYLGEASPKTALAAPLYGDFKGLAPLLIQVGSAETLLDDSVRLAGAVGAAEVPVRLEIWPEMIHVWHFFHPTLTAGREAIKGAGDFIAAHFAPKS